MIHHPQINERARHHLFDKNEHETWDVAHALRNLRREFLTSRCPLLQEVDWILKEVDETMQSEIQDFISTECGVRNPASQHITLQKTNRWVFYSIIMLSYGAKATLRLDESAHVAYLEDVILDDDTCDDIVLSFDDVKKENYLYHINISELPALEKYGIHLDLAPFRDLLSAFDTQRWERSISHDLGLEMREFSRSTDCNAYLRSINSQ